MSDDLRLLRTYIAERIEAASHARHLLADDDPQRHYLAGAIQGFDMVRKYILRLEQAARGHEEAAS